MEDDGVVALGGGWWVKSRRKTKASSLAKVRHTSTSRVLVVLSLKPLAGFGGYILKTIGAVCGLSLKTISGGFYGFGPQNPGGGSKEERTTRGGIGEFASRRSY
jgi:hypothetical protein